MIEAYKIISDRLKAELPWLKHVDLFNDQIVMADKEISFNFPAIFIEFGEFAWASIGATQQRGKGVIRFHLAQEVDNDSYQGSSNQDKAFIIMKRYREVHRLLQGWTSPPYFTDLERVTSEQDEVYGPFNIFIQGYATTMVEDTERAEDFVMVQLSEDPLSVTGEMDPEGNGVDSRPDVNYETPFLSPETEPEY